MDIRAAEISAILKKQIKDFGKEAQVSEIGQVLSAPYAATIFADLGADVVKVEKPELGDDARHMGAAFQHGDSLHFLDMNRNKSSVTLDLKSAEGIEQLLT